MPVINGVYTKDFPALGRAPIDTDIIPIAEVANQITYKTTIGEIFNAKVFGTTGAIPKFTSGNTLGDSIITELSDKIGIDIATPNNKLSINSTDPGSGLDLQIGATSYARFGIINPGLPGEPGVDNDCFIGSTINNDFLVRTNNIEALRIDTAQRLTIANIQNALADTDKFLVSESGVVKYRTGAEVLADIAAQGAITLTTSGSSGASTLIGNTLNIPNYSPDLSGYVTLNTAQTITAAKTFTTSGGSNTLVINHSSGSGIALSITKGGNGEGIYVNKTSGSGNAVTIIGTLNATTLVKNGGTSSQFLKADGSVDSTAYGTGSVTSVAALTLGTSGTDLNSSVANGTTTPVITLNVPDASASNRGVITTGTQTFAGAKTFSSDLTVNTLTVGRGGGAIVSNTAFGINALLSNTTGQLNTSIGYNSGYLTNAGAANETSQTSVYIGADTRSSANGNTNEIVIGCNGRGGGSNSATLGNTSITTTILHGNTSIGYTTNPSLYKLDVNGTGRFTGALTGTSATFSGNATASSLNVAGAGYWPTKLITLSGAEPTRYSGNIGLNIVGGSTIAMSFGTRNNNVDYDNTLNIINGNVGIGTTSPQATLDVVGKFRVTDDIILAQTNGRIDYDNGVTGALRFYSTSTATERLRITSGGNVGIGTTTPAYQLQLSTDSAAKPTSALWTIASDKRIKENITPYTKGLTDLLKINPVNYDYNGLGGFKKGKGGVGIIAQEIIDILPDSVSSIKAKLNEDDKDEIDILNFNGHELTYVLINAIKEQQAQIEELKALINK
jgi:hypothetical protein